MKILGRAGLVAALFLLTLLLIAPAALAQGKADGPAKALQKKAMDEDYLSLEFDKAAEKLTKAIALCGVDKCAPLLRAQLRRDLGVVQIGSGADKEKGSANFIEALKIEPTLALDPDVKTKELEAAFDAARKKAGSAATAVGPVGPAPAGDFTHTPVAGQAVRTPVPIFVEYAGTEVLAKVIVRYKGFGMTEFKTLELKKIGVGYGGTIPCVDVGQQGNLQYYVQGFNAANDPVATAGDRNNTYKVPIKTKFEGEAPHLPDQPAPTQCVDTGDCPPGFPCAKKAGPEAVTEGGSKAEGEECEESSECKSNACKANKCTAPEEVGPKKRRIWIGVAGAIDLVFLPSAQDVCKLDPMTAIPTNSSGYYCTNSDGVDYPSRTVKAENESLAPGKGGSVNGGAALANIRVMLTADYAVNDNILIGARFGFVAKTYPGAAGGQDGLVILPIHAEARFTYLIGKEAINKPFAPYAFGAFGLSQSSAEVDVPVSEAPHADPACPMGQCPGGNKTVQAWAIGGPLFGAVGGGVRVAIGPRAAIMFAPLKLNFAFGKGSLIPSLQPELGVQVGF